jgi:hypothetical protein
MSARHASAFHFPSFERLFDYLMRGMMWRIGGRVINVLPFTVIILIVIVFVIIAIYKYINGQRH